MSKYFWGYIFLLLAFADKTAFSQQPIYRDNKQFISYFERKNPTYNQLFDLLGDCPQDAFIKYYTEIEFEVFRHKEMYFMVIKSNTKKVECMCRYKNFLVCEYIFADKITFSATINSNDVPITSIYLQNKDISSEGVVFDTTFNSDFPFNDFQFSISEITYNFSQIGFTYINKGLNKIDDFFLFDSLFNNWQQQFRSLDLSNVDMIPIYQYQLKDIEYEIKRYDSNEYEILLSTSSIDNGDYLLKRATLFRQIDDTKLNLSKKIAVMDNLMFEKGKQFEKEHNIEKAIFYYNRTLDYNPLHCDALERLSDLYSKHNLNKDNLELFTSLRIRGEDVSCEATLTSSVCDSICTKVAFFIEKNNYYDANKLLDTLELLLYQITDNSYMQTYQTLRKQAQDGIYNSYLDVINRAIRGNKLDLSKEYIYGLVGIMQDDKNIPFDNPLFTRMIENLISRYKENVKNTIKKKKYEEVIRGNDQMMVFLDSINYKKPQDLFFDSYSISCNEVFVEKRQYSQEDAQEFFNIYGKYINLSTQTEIIELTEDLTQNVKDERRYKSLRDYILWSDIATDNYSMFDSIRLFFQLEKQLDYTVSAIDSFFIDKKVIPLLMNTLSKINQYSWTNEFSYANNLMTKIDNVIFMLDFSKETSYYIMDKYSQSTELLSYRINLRAEVEFNAFCDKIQQLTRQKQYFEAYQLLNNENLFLRKTVYQTQLNQLLETVEFPAVFQGKMLSIEQNMALGDFTLAFREYEDAYNYFIKNNISAYGLTCDSLFAFIMKNKRENLLKSACNYYIELSKHISSLDIMMYLINLGYKSEEIQAKLGLKMRQSSYNFVDLSKNYSFDKRHKVFVENFVGKFKGFWYYISRKK